MGQRDDRHQHANRRRKVESQQSAHARESDERRERVPLVGHEELYEISRQGRIYSRKTGAAQAGVYDRSPFVRIAVKGAIVSLPKDKAIAESFARAEESGKARGED
jgi:hypothetical protein